MSILAAIVISTTLAPAPIVVEGWASQYARNVMRNVIIVRQSGRTRYDLPLGLPVVDGYIAVLDCRRIGEIVGLRRLGTKRWERFLIVDCAGHDAREWMIDGRIIAEVDYWTAKRWWTLDRGIKVEMSDILNDSRKCSYVNDMTTGEVR